MRLSTISDHVLPRDIHYRRPARSTGPPRLAGVPALTPGPGAPAPTPGATPTPGAPAPTPGATPTPGAPTPGPGRTPTPGRPRSWVRCSGLPWPPGFTGNASAPLGYGIAKPAVVKRTPKPSAHSPGTTIRSVIGVAFTTAGLNGSRHNRAWISSSLSVLSQASRPRLMHISSRQAAMVEPITYVGLDVHKETIAVALVAVGKRSEARAYGTIANPTVFTLTAL
jgi:hypothetical protein